MHGLNEALEVLRTTLPNSSDAKMTKIETLRYACNYISALAASVKLLEQNKGREDFGHELPNPDDYAFMLNFHSGVENVREIPQNSNCHLPVSRRDCDINSGFNSQPYTGEPQQHHRHGDSLNHLPQHLAQLAPDVSSHLVRDVISQLVPDTGTRLVPAVGAMDTSISNTDTFLLSEQQIFQSLDRQPQNVKQEHDVLGNPNSPYLCFTNSPVKSHINDSTLDHLLNSVEGTCDLYYDPRFSDTCEPRITPPVAYNASIESKQSISLHHRQLDQLRSQQRVRQVPAALTPMPLLNGFTLHQQHEHHSNQSPNKRQQFSSNISAANPAFSLRTDPAPFL